jgi:predicted membrane channel-forming protein YqfA (hemolysin III family)
MVICYTFMDSAVYDYLMIAIMLVGSYTIFWKIYLDNPFYNRII